VCARACGPWLTRVFILLQGAWYAEFVFLYYKIGMAALSVLLGSSARTSECLAIMGVLTGLVLAFVLRVTPFDDNDGDRSIQSQLTTKADKTQASALAATIAGCAAGYLCKVTEDRGAALDAIVGLLVAIVGFLPLFVSYYLFQKPEPTRVVQVVPKGEQLSTTDGSGIIVPLRTMSRPPRDGDDFDETQQIDADIEVVDIENDATEVLELVGPEPADPPVWEAEEDDVKPCCKKYTYCDILIWTGCGTVAIALLFIALQLAGVFGQMGDNDPGGSTSCLNQLTGEWVPYSGHEDDLPLECEEDRTDVVPGGGTAALHAFTAGGAYTGGNSESCAGSPDSSTTLSFAEVTATDFGNPRVICWSTSATTSVYFSCYNDETPATLIKAQYYSSSNDCSGDVERYRLSRSEFRRYLAGSCVTWNAETSPPGPGLSDSPFRAPYSLSPITSASSERISRALVAGTEYPDQWCFTGNGDPPCIRGNDPDNMDCDSSGAGLPTRLDVSTLLVSMAVLNFLA
jgi:hypothetical protein